MALQLSVTARNARLDSVEVDTGVSAILAMNSGSLPANCAASETGTRLVTMALPSDWMANASGGSKAKSGTWQDTSADATGTVGYFRIYKSDGVTCQIQGTMTATGGGGDMTIDSTSVTSGQQVTVTAFSLSDANA